MYIAVATIPGTAKGSITLRKAVNLLHPSILAASSSSPGMDAKNPLIIQILKGTKNAEIYYYKSWNRVYQLYSGCFLNFNKVEIKRKQEHHSRSNCVARIRIPKKPDPGNLYFAKE